MPPTNPPATVAAAAARSGRLNSRSTGPVRMATLRRPVPARSRTAVRVMPVAFAAAIPVTPQGPSVRAPIQDVATMPAAIAATGYQAARPAEK